MGAVPYVTNGADVMAPGITEITPGLKIGTFVTIVDENFGKSLAIGELLKDSDEILETKKGKVIKNLHFVNDDIWSLEL
jgi:PUA domain protein